jgi:hypothetical protein
MATWHMRSWLGNPIAVISSITAAIAASRSSASGVPACFHLSGSATTATGTSKPYRDLEYRWRVTGGAEAGQHTFTLTWRVPIINNIVGSTTVDTHTDQVGPECTVRFFEPGSKEVTCDVSGKNSLGQTVTASATVALTVTQHAITNDRWYDADSGNAANDGLDPNGFAITSGTLTGANVPAGLYTINGKIDNSNILVQITAGDVRTLTKANAFTSYDHAAAIAPTDSICRSNKIYITVGTAAGGISTSTGPRKEAMGTTPASNRTIHLRGGNTLAYTVGGSGSFQGDTGSKFIAWGTARAKIAKLSISATTGAETATDHCWHRIYIDTNNVSGDIAVNVSCLVAGVSAAQFLIFSDCQFLNGKDQKAVVVTGAGNADTGSGLGFWGCDVSQPQSIESSFFVKQNQWMFFMGGSITGTGNALLTLDHHIYPALRGHFLCAYMTFGPGAGRNYCINTDAAGADGSDRLCWNIRDNLMTGTRRAWDASNGGGGENCWLKDVVCERNVCTGLTDGGQVLFYNARDMVVRDNIIYGNSGGRFFEPDAAQTTSGFELYENQAYTAMASTGYFFILPDAIAGCQFHHNSIWDARGTDVRTLSADFTDHLLSTNRIYSPNNAGTVVTNTAGGGTSHRTFLQYKAEADAAAVNSNPGWTDPANGNFSIASGGSSGGYKPSRVAVSVGMAA